jgi:hypothetical protein
MATLRNDTVIRNADGQATSAIITAANISSHGLTPSSTYYIGTTQNIFNRASGVQTLTGVSIDSNAGTATILQTARNINGTSFNGSAAITTASWGTARTLTIGSTGKSVDGSAAIAWSLAEIGAAAIAQTMFIGTTSIAINRGSASQTLTGVSIDGNAATVGGLLPIQFFNNMGDNHTTRTSFDVSTPSYGFGFRFIQGNTNGPATGGGSQFYSWYIGLGNDYPATGGGSYGMHVAVARNATTPYMSVRYNENNSLGSWLKIAAGYADTAGNASTVTTNANLTGHITSVGNAASLGSFTSAQLLAALTDETGTGANVFATSPTLVTPILGTPSSGNLANCTFPTLNQNTTGNAATATNVAWTGITGGARTNYLLEFQPPANSYAGFAFKTSAAGEAGYFLIRGTSDTDVYTAEGITLVADSGWLTLAQRTTASRGVRIMTGTSSAERLKITTAGDVQIVNGNSFTYNSNVVLHAGNYTSYPDATKLPLTGGTLSGVLTLVSSGTAINISGQSDSFGYNATAGQGTYIKGTGSTYIYGGGTFYDGTAVRTLLHSSNYTSYPDATKLPLAGGTLTGGLIVNNDNGVRASYDNGGSYAWLYGYGIEFGRATSYIRPNTNRVANLWVGNASINSLDWANIDFYSSGRFNVNNNAILHAGNVATYALPIGGGTLTGGLSGTTGSFSGDLSIAGYYQIRGGDPTITLRDTDHRTAFIHVNSNIFYILTGAADSARGSWGTVANSRWPLEINLSTNNASFGADVNAISFTGAGTGLTGTASSLSIGGNSANVNISNLATQQVSISLAAGAWYTIAANDANRASAKFTITDTSSGLHQAIHFYATAHYGTDSGAKISVISNTYYGGPPVSAIKIMRGSTYDGAMVQIYAMSACALTVSIYDNQQSSGWVIKSGVVSTTNPGTVAAFASLTTMAAQVDLSAAKSFSVSDEIYIGGATTQYKALHTNNYGSYSTFSGSVTSTYGNFTTPGLIIGDAQYGFYTSAGNVYYKSGSGGVHYWRNIANNANVLSIDNSGNLLSTGYVNVNSYIYSATYFQTGGNLIYPAGLTSTQRLEVGNASGNAWVDGLTIAQGGNVTVYNNLTVNNAATVTNDLTVNGNTYLGNAGGDTVFVNDIIRIGATDSGDASLFFGEGSVAGSDYGARWYWDSGYTFTWYTRNAGTDTALFDYVTNDTTYLNWRRHFHMQNKEINYNAQIHFNAGTRFVGQDTNYLIFRSDATNAGGIRVQDGGVTTKGYIGYWDSGGGGILNNTGNWAVRYNFGSANSGGSLYGTWAVENGNVGIGTTGPSGKLHVYNSAAADTYLESGTSGTTGKLIFKTSDNADLNKYIMQESFYMVLNGHANEGFKFRDSNGNVLLSIFGAQNAYASRVGIGTTTPGYKLDVNGTARFGGIIYNEAVQTDDFNYFNLQPYVESETLSSILSVAGTAPTFTTLTNTAAPFSKVLSVSAYGEALMSEFIPVQAGETIYGEIWAYRATGATGTAGVLYCGVQRYDKDKKMIDSNGGLNTSPSGYFIASNQTIPSNSTWTKYSGTLVLPTSHTPYNTSDGGPVRYIRPYIIYNYTGGTILTYIGGWKIRKVQLTRDSGPVTITGDLTATNILSSSNSGTFYTNTGSGYGSWRIGGTRNGWYGIEFDSGSNLMMNSNQVGFHRNGYGWQLWWSAGTAYCHKGDPGAGTQATILDSSNVASYALPIGGGAITGNSTFSASNHLTFGPNTSWSRYLRIGGDGYTAPVTTTASVVTTNGNLHLDAAKAAGMGIYLNWYGGAGGTLFGNGSGTQVGAVDGSGNASFIGSLDMTAGPVNAYGQLRTLSQVRATGWYNSPTGTSYTGLAAELGMSAGEAYLLCYNRDAGAYGVLNIAGSASNLRISGSVFNLQTGSLQQGGNQVLHAGNYNSYAPTLTGTGASGTWSINVTGNAGGSSTSCTGNAATATTTDNINGRAFYNRDSGNGLAQDSYTNNGIGYVTSVSLYSQTDGGMYASAYSTSWVHQIYGDFRTGQIAVRGKNSGTLQAWRRVLDETNSPYAWAMNQNVGTGNSPSFTGLSVINTITGAVSGSSGSCTGNAASASSLAANTNTIFKVIRFTGEGYDSGNGAYPTNYGIYQEGGSWTYPYPDLCIGFHTGIKIGAQTGYGGIRFYNTETWGTEIFSVGNGDNNVRVVNTIYAGAFSGPLTGNVTGNLTGNVTGTAINIAGNGAGYDTYGTIGVTEPAGASNYSYYGLTRQSNIGAGFGLTGTNGALGLGANAFWFGSATSTAAGVMGSAYIAFNGSSLVAVGTVDATQFRDRDDTTYYLDPAGTSNLNKFSTFTMSYNDMNSMHTQSPYVSRYGGSTQYRNGTMGYGNTDCNAMFSNWGSGFIDSWGSPSNAPGGSSHYVGFQSLHYNHQNSANGYGFQMLCAGESTNRFFWRSAWATLNSWVEMIHSGNIASQTVATAGSCTGNAANITAYTINQSVGTGNSPSFTGLSVINNITGNVTGSATSISGFNNPTTSATVNTIVYRDSGGDIYGRYLFGSYVNSSDDTGSTGLTYIMAKFGNDYHRSATADKVAAFISGQTMNINGSSTSCSGSAASAGALNTSNDYTVASLTSNGFVYSGSSAGSTGAFYFNSSSHGIRRASGTNDVYCYTTSGTLYLGAGGSSTTHVRVTSGGDVGIGVSPSYKLDVNGNIHATAFPTSSDIRFKKNITPLENSLEKIKKLQGVKYEWNEFVNSVRDGYKLNVPIIGLIAQDVEKIVPEVVDLWKLSEDCQDARSIDYPRLIPVLIEAIKEQQTIIENQNQKIENLIARMSALESK